MSNRHRAEVIEIYLNGAQAAVRFSSGRIEFISKRGSIAYVIGQKGMVDYVRSLLGYEWIFTPNKKP